MLDDRKETIKQMSLPQAILTFIFFVILFGVLLGLSGAVTVATYQYFLRILT